MKVVHFIKLKEHDDEDSLTKIVGAKVRLDTIHHLASVTLTTLLLLQSTKF